MRRLFWVAVGATAGVYVAFKVQKKLHSYSPSSLAGRAAGAGGSLRAFAEDVRLGMAAREAELREALGLGQAHEAPLTPAEAADLMDHPASTHRRTRSVR